MITWPNGKKVAVTFAFDVDLELNWSDTNRLDPGHVVHMSKGSYGAKQGVPRILNMFDTHGVKSTFFIPAYNAEVYPDMIREISNRGHEIAFHGYRHYVGHIRTKEDDLQELEQCEKIFLELTGKKLVGYRSWGEVHYKDRDRMVLERGYKYISVHNHRDGPSMREIDGKVVPLVDLGSDAFYDDTAYDYYIDSPPARYGIKTAKEHFQIWADEFDGMAKDGGRVMDFVIHPQFIGKASRVRMLGDLIGYMKSRGAWIATNEEIADYVLKQNGFTPAPQVWK
ncbi:polysaccharide deacetylase family protein [Oscillospiraceae bacterium OttesenSCG-928-G22]|nr:polysaccharide deacetylase family protein [Oscillospiraceae bacterium OttesenSCG-928-G22]